MSVKISLAHSLIYFNLSIVMLYFMLLCYHSFLYAKHLFRHRTERNKQGRSIKQVMALSSRTPCSSVQKPTGTLQLDENNIETTEEHIMELTSIYCAPSMCQASHLTFFKNFS